MDIVAYWKAALSQNADEMKAFFTKMPMSIGTTQMNASPVMNLSAPTASIQAAGTEKSNALKRLLTSLSQRYMSIRTRATSRAMSLPL